MKDNREEGEKILLITIAGLQERFSDLSILGMIVDSDQICLIFIICQH